MSRYSLRLLAHHPVRWAACWWLHLIVFAAIIAIAVAWTAPVYDPVRGGIIWSIVLAVVAGLVLASALAPLERTLVNVTAAAMTTVGIARAGFYVELIFTTDVSPALLVGLASKWLLFGVLGFSWTTVTQDAGLSAAVESGRNDGDDG